MTGVQAWALPIWQGGGQGGTAVGAGGTAVGGGGTAVGAGGTAVGAGGTAVGAGPISAIAEASRGGRPKNCTRPKRAI